MGLPFPLLLEQSTGLRILIQFYSQNVMPVRVLILPFNLFNVVMIAGTEDDFLNPSTYVKALHFRTASLLSQSAAKMQDELASNPPFTAWNNTQVFFLQVASKAYIEQVITERCLAKIETVEDHSLKQALQTLCHLFGTSKEFVQIN